MNAQAHQTFPIDPQRRSRLAATGGSAIICPHCGKPEGAYLYDVPVYFRWSNADSQRMHHKYGCKSCDKTWTERISPNDQSEARGLKTS